jgi:GTPase SAR1 family protein
MEDNSDKDSGKDEEHAKVVFPMDAETAEKQDDVKKGFVKIVAIGDSGVGKTSLVQMF